MGGYDPNGEQPRRGGGGGGLLIALLMVLFAIFTYMSQVEENPVTGKRQHVAISPSDEIRLGLQSAPEMAREMGGEVSSTDPHAQAVTTMGQYLVAKTKASKSPWKFKFHLLTDNRTVNAFALPGGQIFITQGLLEKLETEAQLAGVLSHEMGHVIERHTAQQMAKQQLGQLLVGAVATGASDSPYGDPTMIAQVVNQMFQLRYSRQDESQADEWGLMLMSQAGYNPKAMIEVMEILKKAGGPSGESLEIFQTHPNPDLRIQQIREFLAKNPPGNNLTEGRKLKDIYRNNLSRQSLDDF